jgi:hypothetical protein
MLHRTKTWRDRDIGRYTYAVKEFFVQCTIEFSAEIRDSVATLGATAKFVNHSSPLAPGA